MNATGVCHFKGPGPEVGYFYSENGLGVIFATKLQNRKPQMPKGRQPSGVDSPILIYMQ